MYWPTLPEDYLLSTILDPRIKLMNDEGNGEEILRKKYEEFQENFLPTPIESRAASPTFNTPTINYQPKLFSIFDQNQPRVSDEVIEYLKEDKINFNQNPFEW